LLHECWLEASCTDRVLNQCYESATANGALGGIATRGASGGFLIVYCPTDRQDGVASALEALGLQRWPLTLEDSGVQVMQVMPLSWPEAVPVSSWRHSAVSRQPLRR
jgi:galactokinase/mevalonate kinase-like predicted kinase